jgi:hypothetical protein
MMERKPRFSINPPAPKFVFDKDSTKEFGGMVIDRKLKTGGPMPRYNDSSKRRPRPEGAKGPQSGKLKPRKNKRMIP